MKEPRYWHYATSATFTKCGIRITDEPKVWWRSAWRRQTPPGVEPRISDGVTCPNCWAVHDQEKMQKATNQERLRQMVDELKDLKATMDREKDCLGLDEIMLIDWTITTIEADLLINFLEKKLEKTSKPTEPVEEQWHVDPSKRYHGRRI